MYKKESSAHEQERITERSILFQRKAYLTLKQKLSLYREKKGLLSTCPYKLLLQNKKKHALLKPGALWAPIDTANNETLTIQQNYFLKSKHYC